VPYSDRIAEIGRAIDETMAELARLRLEHAEGKLARRVAQTRIDKLLVALAKLKAEKLRLAIRQIDSNSN
jgi:hypothetical protein